MHVTSPEPLLLTPGDDGWDAARQAWNLAADQHPAAVAFVDDAAGVATVVGWARERGLRISAQGTGHGAAALGDLSDTLLLKTVRLAGVELDAGRRRVRVGGGALWGAVAVPAGEVGLAALHGSSATVGVVGYTLGGGIGWLSRQHGLASNSVVAFDVVTADGEARRVDAESEPDLFWALRGGGGAFAVVTAAELELVPLREAYAGMLVWPAEREAEVLGAWREWTRSLPDSMSSSFRWLQLPPLPDIPEPLAGKRVVAITLAYAGDASEGEALLAPLLALDGRTMEHVAPMPAAELRTLNGDPEEAVPALSDQALLADIDVDALCAAVAGPLTIVELRHLGGALGREPEGAGALARLDGEFLLFALGLGAGPEAEAVMRPAIARVLEAVAPQRTGSYLNFADTPVETASAFPPATWERLRAIKAAVDPDDLIRSNRPV